MREAYGGAASGARRRYGFVWAVVCAFVAAIVGMMAFAGATEAQSGATVPENIADEGLVPTTANKPCTGRQLRAHPAPVILVHGTFENAKQNWEELSAELVAKDYCVFALNYGGESDEAAVQNGLGPIQASARELDGFVNDVLRFTKAKKVSVVGHSQGGMMPRYWIKYLGGKSLLDDLVGIAPSNYGTEISQANTGGESQCRACEQQAAGSRFLRKLNSGDDTPGGGSFTQIATDDDEIIVPYTNCFLRGQERTTNVTLQNYRPYRNVVVTHQNIYQDPYAKALVFDALGHAGPAKPGRAQESLVPVPAL